LQERDTQFQYIALELCSNTLQEVSIRFSFSKDLESEEVKIWLNFHLFVLVIKIFFQNIEVFVFMIFSNFSQLFTVCWESSVSIKYWIGYTNSAASGYERIRPFASS